MLSSVHITQECQKLLQAWLGTKTGTVCKGGRVDFLGLYESDMARYTCALKRVEGRLQNAMKFVSSKVRKFFRYLQRIIACQNTHISK